VLPLETYLSYLKLLLVVPKFLNVEGLDDNLATTFPTTDAVNPPHLNARSHSGETSSLNASFIRTVQRCKGRTLTFDSNWPAQPTQRQRDGDECFIHGEAILDVDDLTTFMCIPRVDKPLTDTIARIAGVASECISVNVTVPAASYTEPQTLHMENLREQSYARINYSIDISSNLDIDPNNVVEAIDKKETVTFMTLLNCTLSSHNLRVRVREVVERLSAEKKNASECRQPSKDRAFEIVI